MIRKICLKLLLWFAALSPVMINAQSYPHEKAFLHTDRNVYITGETAYYKLYILNNENYKLSGLSKSGYILLRQANSNPSIKIKVKLTDGIGFGSVLLPDTLSSGAYQLVAYTLFMKNHPEAFMFTKNITIINRLDRNMDFKILKTANRTASFTDFSGQPYGIKTEKSIYGKSEKVTVHLSSPNQKAKLSVSVHEIPEVPWDYVSFVSMFNNTQKKNWPDKKLPFISPEWKGKVLRGYVTDTVSGTKKAKTVILLTCADSVANLQYAVTNTNGLFQFLLTDYYSGKELFLTIPAIYSDNETMKISLNDDFELNEKWNPTLIQGNGNYKHYLTKSQNMVYINKMYNSDPVKATPVEISTANTRPAFFINPDITIFPAEYEMLDNFREISVELLPQVKIVKEKENYSVKIYCHQLRNYLMRSPAIFLDGVYLDDINKIIGFNSAQIKKIELITEDRAFGDLIFGGMISITTHAQEITKTKPATYSLRYFNEYDNIGSKIYAAKPLSPSESRFPYFKQLLYWNADFEIKGDGNDSFNFYTSDNTGNFIIQIEGIAEDGTPISLSTKFKVAP